jgi:hypothetical protein
MAGLKGRSGPPGNQNGFKHGLAAVDHRRAAGVLTPAEYSIREEILAGLITDKGGDSRISTSERILAEIVVSDAALLTAFNRAIDNVLENNAKARMNPKALSTLDGYKRPLINSLAGNLSKFGFDRVTKVETLAEIIEEMQSESADSTNPGCLSNGERHESDR